MSARVVLLNKMARARHFYHRNPKYHGSKRSIVHRRRMRPPPRARSGGKAGGKCRQICIVRTRVALKANYRNMKLKSAIEAYSSANPAFVAVVNA